MTISTFSTIPLRGLPMGQFTWLNNADFTTFSNFDLFIYHDLEVKVTPTCGHMRALRNAIQRTKPGVDVSTNDRYMTFYVKMTFAAFRGHEHGNTRMLAYEVIDGGPPFANL